MHVFRSDWEIETRPSLDAGLVVFNDDPLSGPTVQHLLGPSIRLQVARIPFPADDGPTLAEYLATASATILPSEPLGVIGLACTTGAVEIGPEGLAEAVARPGQQVTCCDPISAAEEALVSLGVGKVAIVCPYEEADSRSIADAVSAQGFDVTTLCYMAAGDDMLSHISQETVLRCAHEAVGDADALFISCTGLNSTPLIETLERELDVPVLTSLQVLSWRIARELGHTAGNGKGRLFKV